MSIQRTLDHPDAVAKNVIGRSSPASSKPA